ncbi:MAG: hypothetical protein K0U54_04295 [Bacteroidetes bacterium]|nr:hypothetical protein [Bacteroidota bacterium]
MKNTFLLLAIITLSFSCKNEVKDVITTSPTKLEEAKPTPYVAKDYPEDIAQIFAAHGTMEQWDRMNNLCYELSGRNGKENQTISLKDRKVKIETQKWSIGYNGEEVWLLQNEPDAYKGNARFYHNLYFYFYAMPFVLGDDGIIYETVPSTSFEGELFEGVKVSYEAGIGDSPKDEYIVYYDPETHFMKWLAYTVTYGKEENSDQWGFIKYEDWITVNGVQLPKKLTWFSTKDNLPTEARNSMEFHNITLTESVLNDAVFDKPVGATVAKK